MLLAFKLGLMLGLSLIISIGTQNLFVIKQGLRNEHPYLAASLCTLCDFILIMAGATGVSMLFIEVPFLKIFLLAMGVIFLVYCGISAIRRGRDLPSIQETLAPLVDKGFVKMPVIKLILLALTFSFLNPQAILDTTMIIGSSANHYTAVDKYYFIVGAMAASFCWFFGIATATTLFGNKLMNVKFWSRLEYVSGFIMIAFAIKFSQEVYILTCNLM